MTLVLSSRPAEAGSGATTLSPSTVYKLLPEAGGSGYPAWETSKAYTNGMMVQSTNNGLNYMCLVTGTSTNDATKAPIGFSDYTEGTCTWRPALAKPRKLVIICNDGDGTAYVTTEYSSAAAGVGKGIRLNGAGGTFVMSAPGDDVPQGAFYVVSATNTSISHIER